MRDYDKYTPRERRDAKETVTCGFCGKQASKVRVNSVDIIGCTCMPKDTAYAVDLDKLRHGGAAARAQDSDAGTQKGYQEAKFCAVAECMKEPHWDHEAHFNAKRGYWF